MPNKAIKNRTTKRRCAGLASSPFIAALDVYSFNSNNIESGKKVGGGFL